MFFPDGSMMLYPAFEQLGPADLMNRGQFLIQFSFFSSKISQEKEKAYTYINFNRFTLTGLAL